MAKLPFIARLRIAADLIAGRRAFGVTYQNFNQIEQLFPGISDSGERIDALAAMQTGAVYACVHVISETIASLPIHLYEKTRAGRKQVAVGHPLDELVHRRPNQNQTPFEFFEMLAGHFSLRGNAYALIARDGIGVSALIPMHPAQMSPIRLDNGRIVYDYIDRGSTRRYSADEILHIKGLTDDGLIGIGPLQLARTAIGSARSTERYAARFFANNGRPSGVLKTDSQISTDPEKSKAIKEQIRADWMAMVAGERQHGVAILDQGLGWQEVGVAPEDAQMLETRKFDAINIARWFRMPPHKIGALDRATWGNIESQNIEFATDTIGPPCGRIEQYLDRALLTPEQRQRFYFKFNLSGLLRGDIKSRYDSYAIARQWGWLSINDIRSLEDMNPIDGGDEYLSPLNMTPAGSREAPAAPEDSEDGPNLTRRAIAYANHLRSNGNGHQV